MWRWTYTRYSRVADEKQKKVLVVFNGCIFSNLTCGGGKASSISLKGAFWKKVLKTLLWTKIIVYYKDWQTTAHSPKCHR